MAFYSCRPYWKSSSSFQLVPWLLSTGEDKESLGGEGTVKPLRFQHMVEKGIYAQGLHQLVPGGCGQDSSPQKMRHDGKRSLGLLWQRRRALTWGGQAARG